MVYKGAKCIMLDEDLTSLRKSLVLFIKDSRALISFT